MRSGKRLRVAVAGTGMIAKSHWKAYEAFSDDVELVAATDVDPARLADFCAYAHGAEPYPDLDTLLAQARPDLVSVCTPPGAHLEQVRTILAAGAWAWCEKPPCRSLAEYDAITAAEGNHGPYAAFVLQQRSGSAAGHFRTMLQKGELGRALVAHCQTTWYRDAAYYAVPWRGKWDTEGGGPAMGHGIHQMDLLLHLLGEWTEVQAMTARLVHDVETEDVSTALVRFASGALATVVNSVLSPDQISRIRIDCEEATAELNHLYGYGVEDWHYTPAPHVRDDARIARWHTPPADVRSSHTAAFAEVLAAYQAGERPPCSGDDARRGLEFVASLYKSAFTGQTVRAGEITPGDPFYRAMNGEPAKEGARG